MIDRKHFRTCLERLVVGALAFVVAVGVVVIPVRADITAQEIALDSEITLLERNDFGSYSHYFIRLRIEGGAATLQLEKDGRQLRSTLPLAECQELWRTLLEGGLEGLSDAPPEIVFPDQSEFTVRYSVNGQSGGFHVYDIDSQSNPLYREIVSKLLAMGNSHFRSLPGGGTR